MIEAVITVNVVKLSRLSPITGNEIGLTVANNKSSSNMSHISHKACGAHTFIIHIKLILLVFM
jgi:hypothetical protein